MTNHPPDPGALPERHRVKELYEKHLPAHNHALLQLAQDMRQLLEQHGLTPAIKYRVKSFDAYYDKLRKQDGAPLGDFLGLRIVCPFLEDIETIASLLAAHYQVNETERKAGGNSFREFGYDSLHLAIRLDAQASGPMLPGVRRTCEVQLRTILQDAWAEVEHELVYKSDIALPNQSIRRKLAALNATLTLSDLIFQELRDYQKELRLHGRKRRATVEKPFDEDAISISHPTVQSTPPRLRPAPATIASDLERTMLQALEAHSSHDLVGAIALYDRLLRMQIDRKIRALVYNHRGMAHFALGNQGQALRDFTSAIGFDPESDRGFANRGLCYRVRKQFARALRDFDQAIRLNPSRPDSYYGRAQTYCDMRRHDLARADCERALAIQSGYLPARQLILALQDADG